MKILSNTQNGGKVVELSEAEVREFFLLARSCDPKFVDDFMANWDLGVRNPSDAYAETMHDFDYSKVFGNVRAFREARYLANKIKILGNNLEDALK